MFPFRIPSYLVCDICPRTDKIFYLNFTLKGYFSGMLIGLIMRYCWLTKEISVKFCWCSCNKQQKKILATTYLRNSSLSLCGWRLLSSNQLSHPLFSLRLASSDRPKFLGLSKRKKKCNNVVKPFFTWNNSFNLKNKHSITAQRTTGTKTRLFFTLYCAFC